MSEPITVTGIVAKWLTTNGAYGLYDGGHCYCAGGTLNHCDSSYVMSCTPVYKVSSECECLSTKNNSAHSPDCNASELK